MRQPHRSYPSLVEISLSDGLDIVVDKEEDVAVDEGTGGCGDRGKDSQT